MPFVSCTQSQVCQLQRLLSEDSTTPDNEETDSIGHALQTNVVFFRHRENYDACQGRYLSPWRARRVTWNFFNSQPHSQQGVTASSSDDAVAHSISSDCDSLFTVQWSRSPSLSSSNWTEDATFMGKYIMGTINIFFPSVLFFGQSTILEIRALLERHCL